jgi:signal transduction histidine kinase
MMRCPDLLAASNLESLEKGGYAYEITRLHPDTGRWEAIASSGGPLQAPVESTIDVPNGKWKLAVAPKHGWQPSPLLPLKYLMVVGVSGILALLAYLMLRQPEMLRQEVILRTADLEEANRLLEAEIRERRRAEEKVRCLNANLERRVIQRTAQLEGSNRELESFSYSVSHDLRAPLRNMEGFSRILAEEHAGQMDEGGRQCLERIENGIRRMKLHIDSLLQLAQLASGPLRVSTIDLSGMVREIAAEMAASEPGRRVAFLVADGVAARGDANLLRVALGHLLGNAWKFTETRSESRIEFGVSEAGGRRVFFVRDNGVGFDMRYADRLFGAFERLHRAEEYEGSGIGLATVQRIIRRHGGEIWADAEVDAGATFFFTLNVPESPEGGSDSTG